LLYPPRLEIEAAARVGARTATLRLTRRDFERTFFVRTATERSRDFDHGRRARGLLRRRRRLQSADKLLVAAAQPERVADRRYRAMESHIERQMRIKRHPGDKRDDQ
jgi:hypothetical protein